MKPTIWVRNPEYCVRECLEVGISSYIWDEPYLLKKGMDHLAFMRLWCAGMDWRSLVVNDESETAIETRADEMTLKHEVWTYGQPITKLEEKVKKVAHTGRMVIIMRLPSMKTGIGKNFMRLLDEIQQDYPDSIIHIHALYSWSLLFGMDWRSVDIEPRAAARGGTIHMPNGKRVRHTRATEMPEWVSVTGMRVRDLELPRNRCIFNLRSALWAAENYKETPKFATKFVPRGPFSKKSRSKRIFFHLVEPEDGDKLLCNTCSLTDNCRYYREGAICAVPDSEVADLATYFNTRNADAIIEGLGELLSTQAARLQRGMNHESNSDDGELDPAVTNLFDKMFKNGERLAKLINPALAKPGLQINVANIGAGVTPTSLTGENIKPAVMAAIVGELEAMGYARHEITPELIEELLTKKAAAALPAGA